MEQIKKDLTPKDKIYFNNVQSPFIDLQQIKVPMTEQKISSAQTKVFGTQAPMYDLQNEYSKNVKEGLPTDEDDVF